MTGASKAPHPARHKLNLLAPASNRVNASNGDNRVLESWITQLIKFKQNRAIPKFTSVIRYSRLSIRITFRCHQVITEKFTGSRIFECMVSCECFFKPDPSQARFRHQKIYRIFVLTLKTWAGSNPYRRVGSSLAWKLKLAIGTSKVGPGPTTFQNVPTPMG